MKFHSDKKHPLRAATSVTISVVVSLDELVDAETRDELRTLAELKLEQMVRTLRAACAPEKLEEAFKQLLRTWPNTGPREV